MEKTPPSDSRSDNLITGSTHKKFCCSDHPGIVLLCSSSVVQLLSHKAMVYIMPLYFTLI